MENIINPKYFSAVYKASAVTLSSAPATVQEYFVWDSRLSFRRVFGYGDDIAGVSELRRSGSCHHRKHGGGTAAAQTVKSHHA